MNWISMLWDWITSHATVLATVVSATAAVAVGVFTYHLVRVTKRQAELTRAALEVASKEFISTHRPMLRIRHLRAHLNEGQPVMMSYLVANVGASDAHTRIIQTTIGLWGASGRILTVDTEPEESRTLKAGERCVFIAKAVGLNYEEQWGIANNAGGRLEFRGTIEYTDDNGVDRCTGFWRIRDPASGSFYSKDDPEYEYAD